jgi:hypothetical protein
MDEGNEHEIEEHEQASAKKSRSRAARSRAAQSEAASASSGSGPEDVGHGGSDDGDEGTRADGIRDEYGFEEWDFGGQRRRPRPFDRVAEARLKNLDEALHGPPEDMTKPVLFWDGIADQDGEALESIAAQLRKPKDPPTDDLPSGYASKSGS